MFPTLIQLHPRRHQYPYGDGPFEVVPRTDACRRIYGRGDHVLIGVSPGNSYFTSARVAELSAWAVGRFAAVDIVYADLHVDAMFEACGYTPEHASKRANKEIKAVRRRILRGLDEAQAPTGHVRVRALSEFADSPEYRELHGEVLHAMATDREFQQACEQMVRQVVVGRDEVGRDVAGRDEAGAEMSPAQRRAGLDYIAAELPFFLDTPGIVGVPTSVSCYHKLLPLTDVLYTRRSGLRAAGGQGYAVVRPQTVSAAA